MNIKHEWITHILLALVLSICLFVVIDIADGKQIWELGPSKGRLLLLAITAASFYLGSYIYQRIALFFINRSRSIMKASWKEYILVFLVNFILLNLMYILIVFSITHIPFVWGKSLLINVTISVLLFLYYTIIRNRILFKSFIEQSFQLEKVKVDQLEAELKFLKSQYHPHFLFNALNTIYFQVDDTNKEAKQSIEQLSDLLRYQLYDIEQQVTMEQEINYLKSYIAFQQLRMDEGLILDMYFDPKLKEQKVHPLLFQPLIENAFKYVRGGYRIQLGLKLNGNQIEFEIKNSILQSQNIGNKKDEGIGIENLKRRLDLLYSNKYNLEIKQAENMFVVNLTINTD